MFRLQSLTRSLVSLKNNTNMQGPEILKASRLLAQRFLDFVNEAVSPFHVVHWARTQLVSKGFKELVETDNWALEKSGKYFFTRNNSTIVAFDVGAGFDPNNTGFKIIGAHTDSPCLRLAPVSEKKSADFHQTCVSTYGGGLWHTWFDRDLILAGKIIYKNGDSYATKLWRASKPLFKVPNLAIHLCTDRSKFEPNTESHLRPIFCSEIYNKLANGETSPGEAPIFKRHFSSLVNRICAETGLQADQILDFDLYFADSHPAQFFGLNEEYISSPRLDNLFSSFHAITSILQNPNSGSFVNVVALFDHEECGSESAQGAGSNIINQATNRIFKLLCPSEGTAVDNYEKTIQRSYVISADMAHGLHPNYSEKHQENHRIQINKGVAIKTNVNQRYATDSVSASILRVIAEKNGVPLQDFIVKNDSPCGSTIGPIISSKTGIKTIDIGAPMLGMHSIRETCGVLDGLYYQNLFAGFFKQYDSLHHKLLSE